METPSTQSVKIGYRYGLLFFVIGFLFVAINFTMLYFQDKYYPKLLATGLALAFISPIFIIFPGGSVAEMPKGRELNRVFWKNAPTLHRIMWIVWGTIAIAFAFFALISFDPDFYK